MIAKNTSGPNCSGNDSPLRGGCKKLNGSARTSRILVVRILFSLYAINLAAVKLRRLSVYLEDREPVRLLEGALEAVERAVMS